MKENSIEEDIERLKLCSTNQCNICGRYEKEECMLERNRCEQHILSAYKKILKENEELKEDRKNNNEMIALAQNEILNYMSGYEEGKKHKMTAVAQVVENQQYYIVRKQMEKYEEHIKRLQKENEELKERIREHTLLISPYYVKENYTPNAIIRLKIAEYKERKAKCNDIETEVRLDVKIRAYEELLEKRKKNI